MNEDSCLVSYAVVTQFINVLTIINDAMFLCGDIMEYSMVSVCFSLSPFTFIVFSTSTDTEWTFNFLNSNDKIVIKVNKNIGIITKINIRHDDSGAFSGWHLNMVIFHLKRFLFIPYLVYSFTQCFIALSLLLNEYQLIEK